MRKTASGSMSNTPSGARATRSGNCTTRPRTFSSICLARTWSTSRVTSTTGRYVSQLKLRAAVHSSPFQLTYDCAAPASTDFEIAIGPMASAAGAPKVCSMRTIKSDVVVGLGDRGDEIAERLDNEEPGWKISGKYVSDPASGTSIVNSLYVQAVVLLSEGRPGEKVTFA